MPRWLRLQHSLFLWGVWKPVGINFNDCLLRLIRHLYQRDLCNLCGWHWHFFLVLLFMLLAVCVMPKKHISAKCIFNHPQTGWGQLCRARTMCLQVPNVFHSPCVKVTKIMGHSQADKAKTTSIDTRWLTAVTKGATEQVLQLDRSEKTPQICEFLLLWTNDWITRRAIAYVRASGWLVNTLLQCRETHCTAFVERVRALWRSNTGL